MGNVSLILRLAADCNTVAKESATDWAMGTHGIFLTACPRVTML